MVTTGFRAFFMPWGCDAGVLDAVNLTILSAELMARSPLAHLGGLEWPGERQGIINVFCCTRRWHFCRWLVYP